MRHRAVVAAAVGLYVPISRDGLARNEKSPGRDARGFPAESLVGSEASEAVVDTAANDAGLEVDVDAARQRASNRSTSRLAEIDVEIFKLDGPGTREGVFDARTGRPTDRRPRCEGVRRRRRHLQVAVRRAARGVEHPAIPGVTETAASGTEPRVLGLAAAGSAAKNPSLAALDPTGLAIAYQTKDPAAELVVDADCTADQPAVDIEFAAVDAVGPVGPSRVAPTPTSIDTDVDAGPTKSRSDHRCFVGRSLDRHIRSRSGACETECGDCRSHCDELFHDCSLSTGNKNEAGESITQCVAIACAVFATTHHKNIRARQLYLIKGGTLFRL